MALSNEQLTFLRGVFLATESPSQQLCISISQKLNLKPEQVSRWFLSERVKNSNNQKKTNEEEELDDKLFSDYEETAIGSTDEQPEYNNIDYNEEIENE